MKKHRLTVGFLILLIISLVGCGSQPTGDTSDDSNKTNDNELTFATSIQSGGWFPLGGALGNLINKHTDINVNVIPSEGTEDNARLMKNGESQMALMMASFAYEAYRGLGVHKDERMEDLRTFIMSDPIYMNFIVLDDSDIYSIEDIKGRKIGVGPAGSRSYQIMEAILEAHGLSYDDIDAEPLEIGDQVEALTDGNIEMFTYLTGGPLTPAPALLELNSTHDIRFIELEDSIMDNILSEHPYDEVTMPADLYPGIGETTMLQDSAGVMISAEVSDEIVYEMAKTLFENKEELEAAHNTWKAASLNGIPVPLHPGAEKYYLEEGMTINYLK